MRDAGLAEEVLGKGWVRRAGRADKYRAFERLKRTCDAEDKEAICELLPEAERALAGLRHVLLEPASATTSWFLAQQIRIGTSIQHGRMSDAALSAHRREAELARNHLAGYWPNCTAQVMTDFACSLIDTRLAAEAEEWLRGALGPLARLSPEVQQGRLLGRRGLREAGKVIMYSGTCRCLVHQPRSST